MIVEVQTIRDKEYSRNVNKTRRSAVAVIADRTACSTAIRAAKTHYCVISIHSDRSISVCE